MTSETEKPDKKKIPYKYGMSDPSAYFVARVWEIVEDKAGFSLGPKTKNTLQGRIKQLYLMKLKSEQVGEILFHEWQLHRKLSHRIRDVEEKNRTLEDRPRPRVDVVQQKQPTQSAVEPRIVVDDELAET